jgi:membrane dipeptidase
LNPPASRLLTIDGLNTSLWGQRGVFEDLVTGGVTAINATIAIWDDFESTLAAIAGWYGIFEQYSDLIRPVRSIADIHDARETARCGVIFGWQNATPIGTDLRRLSLFHDLGVRIIQLTYNERNLLGNGCYELHDEGLSKFGRAAVHEMNRTGILIDLSHVGDRTTLDVIELSEKPVTITHSNARSMDDHPRNKTDETIKLLAEKGGVIGSNSFPMFFPRGFQSTLDDYLDRVEYLLQLVGPDHVALGSDLCQDQPRAWFEWLFSSQGTIPAEQVAETPEPYTHLHGFSSAAEFQNIAAVLEKRGYSSADVGKIMGENWLQLFGKVWRS